MKSQLLVYKHHKQTSHCQQQQFVFNFFLQFFGLNDAIIEGQTKMTFNQPRKSAREKIYRLIARFVLFEMCLRRKKRVSMEQHWTRNNWRSLETLLKVFFFLCDGDDFEKWRRRRQTVVICRDTVTWTTGLRCLGPGTGLKASSNTNVNLFSPMTSLWESVRARDIHDSDWGLSESLFVNDRKAFVLLCLVYETQKRGEKNRLKFDMWLQILTPNRTKTHFKSNEMEGTCVLSNISRRWDWFCMSSSPFRDGTRFRVLIIDVQGIVSWWRLCNVWSYS